MKTSVNIPDWLHEECRQLAGDAPFGEQVRDALLIALPTWRQEGADAPLKRSLKARIRLIDAEAAVRAAAAEAAKQRRAARRPATRAKRAPASGLTGQLVGKKPSVTRATKPSRPPARSPRKRA